MDRQKTIIAGVAIAVGVSLIVWFVPILQTLYFPSKVNPADVPGLVNENRRTLAQIIGGLVLLVGLYLTYRRIIATEKTVEIAQEGQITERFTRATDQLGATNDKGEKKLEIRLGGIYALERIARNSESDYWTIMNILAAYVREQASQMSESDGEEFVPHYVLTAEDKQADLSLPAIVGIPRPSQDIAAAFTYSRAGFARHS